MSEERCQVNLGMHCMFRATLAEGECDARVIISTNPYQ